MAGTEFANTSGYKSAGVGSGPAPAFSFMEAFAYGDGRAKPGYGVEKKSNEGLGYSGWLAVKDTTAFS